jgi:hypothetical protein
MLFFILKPGSSSKDGLAKLFKKLAGHQSYAIIVTPVLLNKLHLTKYFLMFTMRSHICIGRSQSFLLLLPPLSLYQFKVSIVCIICQGNNSMVRCDHVIDKLETYFKTYLCASSVVG